MATRPPQGDPEATLLLRQAVAGDRASAAALFDVVYEELRGIADRIMRQERSDHTLQPTGLVHEAFLRLVGMEEVEVRGRDQFFSLAARAMRRILVDHARAKGRTKRGGGLQRVVLETQPGEDAFQPDADELDLIDLDAALTRLGERSPRHARLVELRFFGGLPNAEIASLLGVSETTVERDWRAARAWLSNELTGDGG